MDTITMVKKLIENGYSLSLISKQCGIPYMHLYRSLNDGRAFKDEEKVSIKRFAIAQPCME